MTASRIHLARKVMDDICAWLRANGIEPRTVPEAAVPTIADGLITCDVFLINANGNKYLDEVSGRAAMGTITVPLVVEPPVVLAEWLAQ